MNAPPSSDFQPGDWPGDRGSFGHTPNFCLSCENPFWGHHGRHICRRCDTQLRENNVEIVSDYEIGERERRLRRLLLVMLPLGVAMWIVIYFCVRAWFFR